MATSTNTVLLAYNPNDFFYSDAQAYGLMPSEEKCEKLEPYSNGWDLSCNPVYFGDTSMNCINIELCKNKDYVKNLVATETTHSGSDEKYYNAKQQYNRVLVETINLGIGILFLFGLIIKYK